jgi:uncharacterized protein YndB with AHSA1/START domain
MIDIAKFKPKTVYVIYIASTPEKLWQALTDPVFTVKYFFGNSIEIEPRTGGSFLLRMPDGRVNVRGEVVEWLPPRRLVTTWTVEWIEELRELPPCLIGYDIEPSGESVKLTLTESYQWDVPEAMLAGGRAGWPAILSSLKSVLETGKPLVLKLEPPKEMMAAVQEALAAKPWLQR